jgi:magnesium-transporting ATPase (P-type)
MTQQTATPYEIRDAHARHTDEVLDVLQATEGGLTQGEAAQRLALVGPNRLPAPLKDSLFKRFFKHFNDLLIYILMFAGLVTALLGHWIDTGVIFGVVVINAIIGFVQEGKAEQALEGIRKMLSLHAHARRDGEWAQVEAEVLVPGDIVRLRSGDRVPADLRLIETISLRIEESALTGESVPSEKNISAAAVDAGVGDRHGMAYSGTMVAAGRGIGLVVATGPATEIGRINRMIAEVETLATPLTRQMNQFGKVLAVAILSLAVLMFAVGWFFHDYSLGELFLAAIGFAVAAIPEGLPAVLTITLALGVQRMAQRNAITRRLNAVETLGSVTVICSDKTGTLTRNEMTARHVVTRAGQYDVEGTGYEPAGHILRDGKPATLAAHADLHALIEVMALCNDAVVSREEGQWRVTGEPTEGALRTLARKAGFDEEGHERLAAVPFESENKFMATLDRSDQGGLRILLKGAPDRLLDRCPLQRAADGSTAPLERSFWEAQIDQLSAQGLRVLAAAVREADAARQHLALADVDADMVFLGLVGIIDPPRPEAIEAIKACHRAGIRVKMITGDHAGTALAIGREMGIVQGGDDGVVTGAELEEASDAQLREIVGRASVFARTSPEHKLRLVMALQANGDVVAMTGDGVNDAPALKRADVGVAMGIKGTEATKEAAEIVLADDNFRSIERAVEEGRTIYDNLRKSIVFILPTNGAEGFVMLAAVILGMALPLTPVQILWVNMITAVTLAIALAFEPAEPGVMARPPRRPDVSILDGLFIWRVVFVSLLMGGATMAVFVVERQLGMPVELARTLAVNTLVMGELFYLFNCRSLRASSLRGAMLHSNRVAWAMAAILVVLQLGFVYLPFMQTWFGTVPLEFRHWLVPISIGAILFLIVEVEKAVLRRFFPGV